MIEEPFFACPCGCKIYIYAEKSISYYEGTFGRYLEHSEDITVEEIGKSPNTVKCKKCGKRYPIEKARGTSNEQ